MNLMVVGNESEALLFMLREIKPLAETKGFLHYRTALAEIENGFRPDVAFLDMELCGMNGIMLAQQLKKMIPKINLIFVTSSASYPYMMDAFELHASGYLTKPINLEQIRDELNHLRYFPKMETPYSSTNPWQRGKF